MIVILLFQICFNMTFKCNYCEKEPFELKKFLNDHLAMKHNLEFPCYKCNEAFEHQRLLAEHLSIHNGFQKVFPCEKCKEVFLDGMSLENHMKNRHIQVNEGFKCKFCERSFDYKDSLKKHLDRLHNRKFCNKCCDDFADRESLTKHLSTFCNKGKREGKVYPCTKCDKILNSKRVLKKHEKLIHTVGIKKKHRCDQCQKTFATEKGLESHHATCGTLIKCLLCGKIFQELRNLKIHIKVVHEKQEKHKCNECEKSFVTKKELKIHDNYAHNPFYTFKCSMCETAFTGEFNLKMHTGSIHKKCHICGKKFPTIQQVQEHLKEQHTEQCFDSNFPFAFDSDNIVQIKKEIKEEVKEEIENEVPLCKVKTEDQTFEIEKLRQSYEAIKKELEQSLSRIDHLESENSSLKSQNQSLALTLSSVEGELMKMKQNHT